MASTYTPIAATTLDSTVSSYTFTSIPSSYTDLVLVLTVTSNAPGYLGGRFNGDSGANYSDTVAWAANNAESFRYPSQTSSRFGYCTTANSSMKTIIANFIDYANNTTYKTLVTRGDDSAATGTAVSLYRSTSPITSIQIFFSDGASISANSTLALYGITAA